MPESYINEAVEAFAARAVENATATYTSQDARAALRCALMDAANLCDAVSREMSRGRRKSQQLTEMQDLLLAVGNKLEAMRAEIGVPR